ncbi:MAG: ABC transporter ATP-binding protein [Burkholderiaceae bacterium]
MTLCPAPPVAEVVLETRDLVVQYDGVGAVNGINLVVHRGRITSLVGSNGAGKTTVMKACAGLVTPARGSIDFHGQSLIGMPADRIVRQGLTLVPEGRRLFGSMTVRDNLRVGAYTRSDETGISADFDRVLGYFPMLGLRLDSLARDLSGGQQQMLAVGRALMSSPRLLMLDEPSIGLAPAIVDTIAEIIMTISKSGVDILLVEQNARMALGLADYAYVLDNGRIMLEGSGPELSADEKVKETYLGL